MAIPTSWEAAEPTADAVALVNCVSVGWCRRRRGRRAAVALDGILRSSILHLARSLICPRRRIGPCDAWEAPSPRAEWRMGAPYGAGWVRWSVQGLLLCPSPTRFNAWQEPRAIRGGRHKPRLCLGRQRHPTQRGRFDNRIIESAQLADRHEWRGLNVSLPSGAGGRWALSIAAAERLSFPFLELPKSGKELLQNSDKMGF